ncbi:MAG: hypothetical protein ACFFHD_13460 [Promethearchaeota archaeon]
MNGILTDLKSALNKVVKNLGKFSNGDFAIYDMVTNSPDKEKVKDYIINYFKSQYKIKYED